MNREHIIQMAREAKFATEEWGDGLHHVCVFNYQDSETEITKELEAFAKLVAEHERNRTWTQAHWTEYERAIVAQEREACAKVAETISNKYGWGHYGNEVDTADEIAAAIRARGKHD